MSTPAARADYLRRLLRELCRAPRPSGSLAHENGARLVEAELRRALPQVARHTIPFRRWMLDDAAAPPQLLIDGRAVETYVADHSPATPAGGVRGILRKWQAGSGYEIVDPAAGNRLLARVGMSEFGRAIVTINSGSAEVPLFNIGRQEQIKENVPAAARVAVRWVDNATSSNVVGTLPGASSEEILVVAHADTKYNTPGAHDNTASLIVMLMLAHAVAGSRSARRRRTVSFLATTGEELDFFGAKHYATLRRQQGTLGNIKVCINLDSLTYGPNLQINTTDEALQKQIVDAHRRAQVNTQPKVFSRTDTMDSAPFGAAGARTVHLNSRGDDARTLPLWHRPEDRAETVNAAFAESSFLVLRELLQMLDQA